MIRRHEGAPYLESVTQASKLKPENVARLYLLGVHGLKREARNHPTVQLVQDAAFVKSRLRQFGLPDTTPNSEPSEEEIAALLSGPNVRTLDGGVRLPLVRHNRQATNGNPIAPLELGLPSEQITQYYIRQARLLGDPGPERQKMEVAAHALTIHSSLATRITNHPYYRYAKKELIRDLRAADSRSNNRNLETAASGYLDQRRILTFRDYTDLTDSIVRILTAHPTGTTP